MNAVCDNQPGSYTCTCLPGYEGDGKFCRDREGCEPVYKCNPKAYCVNMGSYDGCACMVGYIGNGTECNGEWK